MNRVGRDPRGFLIPLPLPWTRSGCSRLHPACLDHLQDWGVHSLTGVFTCGSLTHLVNDHGQCICSLMRNRVHVFPLRFNFCGNCAFESSLLAWFQECRFNLGTVVLIWTKLILGTVVLVWANLPYMIFRLDNRKKLLIEGVVGHWNKLPRPVVNHHPWKFQNVCKCGTWGYGLVVNMELLG